MGFSEENHDPLRSQCALAAAKLLKKPDQCRGVLQVSHLFWSAASKATEGKPARDGKKVVDCLKKGLKIARQCMDAGVQVQLLVEILNHYVLFYEAGNANITAEMVGEVVGLVEGEMLTARTSTRGLSCSLLRGCSLLCDDCPCNVVIRKCRNIYLSLSNRNTEVCAFEPA